MYCQIMEKNNASPDAHSPDAHSPDAQSKSTLLQYIRFLERKLILGILFWHMLHV